MKFKYTSLMTPNRCSEQRQKREEPLMYTVTPAVVSYTNLLFPDFVFFTNFICLFWQFFISQRFSFILIFFIPFNFIILWLLLYFFLFWNSKLNLSSVHLMARYCPVAVSMSFHSLMTTVTGSMMKSSFLTCPSFIHSFIHFIFRKSSTGIT
jgi:hypothetical protein